MAVEIMFYANRAEQMTLEEKAHIEKISHKYQEKYKGKEFEGPGCITGEEVNLERVPLLRDAEKGWRLMTDEEYRNLMA